MSRWWIALGVSIVMAGPAWADDAPAAALKGLDPVALAAGREEPGLAALEVARGRYRYRFANEENRKRFLEAPAEHEIQLGGACARMGPLSGRGGQDRFLVHDGHVYIFASDACRDTFRANPERFLDRDDAAPTGSSEERARADEVLGRALVGLGGREAVAGIRNIQVRTRATYAHGERTVAAMQVMTREYPQHFRYEEAWDDTAFGWMLLDGRGFQIEKGKVEEAHPAAVAAMRREVFRDPLTLRRAWQDRAAVAFARALGKVGDTEVDWVDVGAHGATTVLAVAKDSGRIVRTAYRGWAASGIGAMVRDYGDFRLVAGGLTLPASVSVSVDGKASASPVLHRESVDVNQKLDPSFLSAEPPGAVPALPLAGLSWLGGCWAGDPRGRAYEEQWMKPHGDSMLGMSRTVASGSLVAHEFLQIRAKDGGIYYISKPSGQEETAFRLVASGEGEALFENAEHDFPQRIQYKLGADGALLAAIEGTNKGKTQRIEFPMKRVRCAEGAR